MKMEMMMKAWKRGVLWWIWGKNWWVCGFDGRENSLERETRGRENSKNWGRVLLILGWSPPYFFFHCLHCAQVWSTILECSLGLETSSALVGSTLEHGLSSKTSSALVGGILECKVRRSSMAKGQQLPSLWSIARVPSLRLKMSKIHDSCDSWLGFYILPP